MQTLLLFLSLYAIAFQTGATELPAGHPPVNNGSLAISSETKPLLQIAKVISTINVPNYTYLEVSQNNKSRWIAAPTVEVKKDDNVEFTNGAIMTDFYSKTLDRTFPSIVFVDSVTQSN